LVADTTGPVIQAHADLVVDATGPAGASVSYTGPSASDAVDGPVSVVCAPASGSTFAFGHTTVSCTATDAAHNASHSSFDVLVSDTAPAASDSVDTPVSVTCAPASGTVFAFGHTTVTCSAHDASGNAAQSTTFDVQVRDTTGPAIQTHADVVAEATGPGGAIVSYAVPTASDAVDGAVSVTCAPASGTTFALGHTTVTCTAQDAHSNVSHSTFDVNVHDTTAPVIQVPVGMTV